MRLRAGETAARWLLLCALTLGVLAMHHVGSPEGGHAAAHGMSVAATADPGHQPGPDQQPAPTDEGNALLHLCMAVVCAAVGIWLLMRLGGARRERAWQPFQRVVAVLTTPARPPPRYGREILHTVCVLRV